ncbi:hypothetical protein F7D01_07415 [Erythrobacter sp. 3-20A1M]|uniref:Ig-like domain-containing protein n=1 Tax=Erythrobacter sp. 3-20A1M TaxID=2653850 RepID=UPI001BFC3CCE|nr:hypothetical protein [Erythrobacter sp. 3-20A1M]QWC56948.1 hypothetical protein F7D01_07415 [Erythrobacter sp. 3-20A1M]
MMGGITIGGRRYAALFASFALVACGGDDGVSTPTAPPSAPTNQAPTFTSGSAVSVVENSGGTIYTATATDPDGDPVTISISGGSDASAFSISGGALNFVKAPNFDQPTDAGYDNLYQVTLTAKDGKGGAANLALTVEVTNDREGVAVTRLVSGLGNDPVIAARTRGSAGLIAVSQDGTVREFFGGSASGNLTGNVFLPGETGRVLAVAHFNGYGVVMLDISGKGVFVRTIVLQESRQNYSISTRIAQPSSQQARGTLFIGGDGFLFGALGDPGGQLAQDPTSGYGKFYRVQVDPYCGASLSSYCIAAELFGDGVHAPAGGGGYASRSFLLDSGTGRQEEVDYFNQNAQPLDFGWPYREGTYERIDNPPAAVIGPSLTYTYGDGFFQGQGMTGGVYYTGGIGSLDDRVLVTDASGKIFAFRGGFLSDGILHPSTEMENRTADFVPDSGTLERPVAVVRDTDGRLYILDGDGELYVVKSAS